MRKNADLLGAQARPLQGPPYFRANSGDNTFDEPDEIGDEARVRAAHRFRRRAELHDLAIVEDRHAVGHGKRLSLVVGDEYESDAELFLQRLEFFLHLLAKLQIERAERLVQTAAPSAR